jgi:hypothetical protein
MQHPFRSAATCFLLMLTLCLLFTSNMWAQGGGGELSGVVTDPSGAVVPDAQITLSNNATGDKRTTVSTGAGIYRFSGLPVGTYTLEVSPTGFKSTKVANVVVSVGTVTTRDIHLELGAATEQVTVEAGSQLVQTDQSSISQLIDRRVWENMPLEARNPNDFINLVAGAVPEQIAGGTFRGAAVNGTRTGTGNFMLEGVDNNEQGQGGVAVCGTACGQGGANTSLSPDAIQEYRVITHDFNAEYGKAGGFVTDTVLKSGTNQWHGSAFEYNRVQKLTANDWFSNNAEIRDHLVRNQFGGSAGGPIVKDKTFIFGVFEAQRLRQSAPVTGSVFTQQFYDFVNSGAFQQFQEGNAAFDPNGEGFCNFYQGAPCPGAFSGSSTVGPIFQSQLQQFPLAMPLANSSINCLTPGPTGFDSNCFGQDPFTSAIKYPVPLYDTFTQADSNPLNQYRFSFKFDQKLTSNDQFGAVYAFEDLKTSSLFTGGDTTFGVPLSNPNRAQTLGLTWTHSFSPTVLNQFRAGYVRRLANFEDPGTAGIPVMLTIDALAGGFGGSNGIPQFFTENQFQYKDDISVSKGKHGLKFGGEYRRTRNGSSFHNDQYGHFYNWGGESLITDSVFGDEEDQQYFGYPYFGSWYLAGASVDTTNGQVPDFYRGYRANEYAFYGQDDWRIAPRLTLNLGVRWDYFGPPHNFKPNVDSNFYFGTPVTPIVTTSTNPFFPRNSVFYAYEATARAEVRNDSIWNKDTNNFAPRVGFAFDALGNQKLVLRSGFGIFYDRLYNNVFENIRFNPPFFADESTGFAAGGLAGPLVTPGLFSLPFTTNGAFLDPTLFPGGVLPKPVPRHIDQNLATAYYQQWSFGFQYELGKNYVVEGNYVGTGGRKLVGILNRNTFDGKNACIGPQDPGSPCDLAGFPNGFSTTRPNIIFNSDNARGNYYSSNYNAANVTLSKRFSQGLSFNANYTFGKALDELSDVFRSKTAQISATDVQNIKYDYGPADFDVRHRVVVSYNYDLQFMKENRWVGGWALNGIFAWNTGSPVALFNSTEDPNKDGVFTDRPQFIGSGAVTGAVVGKEQLVSGSNAYVYLDPTQFGSVTCPASVNLGLWCNSTLGRNAIHGPDFVNFDFGVSKNFRITESTKLRFDANFFDLFNHPNFKNPNGNFADGLFGQAQATYGDSGGHRVTQLALRFEF